MKNLSKNWILLSAIPIVPKPPNPPWTQYFYDFFHIWSFHQWAMSLSGLVILYWITGHYYNKWLADSGGWLSFKARVWLIFFDLAINLALGLYYMAYRETLMGHIMVKCPIAISPLIFVLEMCCVYIYHRYYTRKD